MGEASMLTDRIILVIPLSAGPLFTAAPRLQSSSWTEMTPTRIMNIADRGGRTALHWACSLDPKSLSIHVNLLLKRDDIDPNSRDSNGETPLTCACFLKCYVPIVRSLLSHRDTDPNPIAPVSASSALLFITKVPPHEEIISLLRAAGASPRDEEKLCFTQMPKNDHRKFTTIYY
jgi:ankyrin repeat protein